MNTKRKLLFALMSVIIIFFANNLIGQVLSPNRSTNWHFAGVKDTSTTGFEIKNLVDFGAIGDSITINDTMFENAISSISGIGAIINFGDGKFLFNHPIILPSNIRLRGNGVGHTTLIMNLNGSGDAMNITGTFSNSDTSSIIEQANIDSNFIIINNTSLFSVGDWIQIQQLDTQLVTSSWANNTIGQIIQISNITNNKLSFNSLLRLNYELSNKPHIHKLNPITNVGIECLAIERIDSTAPAQSSNIHFQYAANCFVKGIESHNCTFSHIDMDGSSNISVSQCYFHDAFHYGENGRAYGVIINGTSNECRVEDNIFKHLRHSMILQSGANGNVFAYNYSIEPFWETSSPFLPTNSAGDMVLHGNYPYLNLFEGNIGQNIVIDDSHGPNGSYNTFFRNRAEGFGIFFSAANSPNQNFIGNEIPNNTSPYNLVNYTIQGTGHFLHGNNNKGTIVPTGTEVLSDISYANASIPDYIPITQWGKIGTPNTMGSANNPAKERYLSGNYFANVCGNTTVNINTEKLNNIELEIYPNPTNSNFQIKSNKPIVKMEIIDIYGKILNTVNNNSSLEIISLTNYTSGIYFVLVYFEDRKIEARKIVRI